MKGEGGQERQRTEYEQTTKHKRVSRRGLQKDEDDAIVLLIPIECEEQQTRPSVSHSTPGLVCYLVGWMDGPQNGYPLPKPTSRRIRRRRQKVTGSTMSGVVENK